MNVLVLNVGSSSLKFQIIATDLDRIKQHRISASARGEVERIGGEAIVTFQAGQDAKRKFTAPLRDIPAALDYLVRYIASDKSGVDGNQEHRRHQRRRTSRGARRRAVHRVGALIDDKVLHGIEDCIDLAPLHNPGNLQGHPGRARTLRQRHAAGRGLRHVVPPLHSRSNAYLYAIPYHLYRRYRMRRYGFHGTSHRYVAFRYRALRGLTREQTNIITFHLGNGCSAAAIRRQASRSIPRWG